MSRSVVCLFVCLLFVCLFVCLFIVNSILAVIVFGLHLALVPRHFCAAKCAYPADACAHRTSSLIAPVQREKK